jgi:addiction module HigA family antidote
MEAIMVRNGLPPIHPGAFLRETLGELALSQAQFARAIGVAPMRISHVINGTRPVTADLALLFGRALGQSPQYWLNLQAAYDLKLAEKAMGSRLRSVAELTSA